MKEKPCPSEYQVKNMEKFSGVELNDSIRWLYVSLRESHSSDSYSDQELLAKVIELYKGDVETFKKAYPQIFNSP
jgi:hypothetical protein